LLDYEKAWNKFKITKDVKDCPLGYPMQGNSWNSLAAYTRTWYYFSQLYKDAIKNGQLKIKLCNFIIFDDAMSSCNRFYFPAMCGEQHGNHQASQVLLSISNKVLKQKQI